MRKPNLFIVAATLGAAVLISAGAFSPAEARVKTNNPYKNVPCSSCADERTFDRGILCLQTCCRAPRGGICASGGGAMNKGQRLKTPPRVPQRTPLRPGVFQQPPKGPSGPILKGGGRR